MEYPITGKRSLIFKTFYKYITKFLSIENIFSDANVELGNDLQYSLLKI